MFFATLLDFKTKLIRLAAVSCAVGLLDLHAQSAWLSLNTLKSFSRHYKLAQALQLKLGLTVCPDCQRDHAETAKADISLWKDY